MPVIERRAATGEFMRLGGMARGRPALATLLMTVGVIALAVPGSTAFAGEFLILAGAFDQGWGWAVVGAVALFFGGFALSVAGAKYGIDSAIAAWMLNW